MRMIACGAERTGDGDLRSGHGRDMCRRKLKMIVAPAESPARMILFGDIVVRICS
jgi:hypothetical protein